MGIKVGDRVRCMPGFSGSNRFFGNSYGGYGYAEDLIFKVERIDYHQIGNILWGITANEGGGVYEEAVIKLEEFTPFPIVKKHYFIDSVE